MILLLARWRPCTGLAGSLTTSSLDGQAAAEVDVDFTVRPASNTTEPISPLTLASDEASLTATTIATVRASSDASGNGLKDKPCDGD